MKPEFASLKLLEQTRSVGKAYELGFQENDQIISGTLLPKSPDPLLVFAVAALGDAASAINDNGTEIPCQNPQALEFASKFFDSYLEARLARDIDLDVSVLASASYLLDSRPGSSLVLIRRISDRTSERGLMNLLIWILSGYWTKPPLDQHLTHELFGELLLNIRLDASAFFLKGSADKQLAGLLSQLRQRAYAVADDYDLLLADLVCACLSIRVASSTWKLLPKLSRLDVSTWRPYLETDQAPRELWPSQIKIGNAEVFSGRSAVVQMPTSAGKTKAIELVIRSTLIARRANAAVIVAPFRALCREISASLRDAFSDVDVVINEVTDTPQADYRQEFERQIQSSFSVLVVTPEKYLYMLRNLPELMPEVGLVIYDEGHQFDSGARGVTYELLLTEIKGLIPAQAQVVLISAVLGNARSLADWLIGHDATTVDGAGIAPTSRVIGFATWLEEKGALDFYDQRGAARLAYEVPSVIESSVLGKRARERKEKVFPEKGTSGDVALYVALKVVQQGAVAIFCGKKDSADKIISRLIDIYDRGGVALRPPADVSDDRELEAIAYLASRHFGADAVEASAARMGVLLHHTGMPEGMRLAAEHAIRSGKAKMVVCTSTLAQGVNLPIRYLIVSSIFQGESVIRARDFQNLMGRAGRSGMHTEGTIIFPDVEVYDSRKRDPWKFDRSMSLIDPLQADQVGSSLRVLVSGIKARFTTVKITGEEYYSALLERDGSKEWAGNFAHAHRGAGLELNAVEEELERRRGLLAALQSYLMAQSKNLGGASLVDRSRDLATGTLAHFLADETERSALVELFEAVAQDLEEKIVDPDQRAVMSKTLLGTGDSVFIKEWVADRIEDIRSCESEEGLLKLVWEIFEARSSSQLFGLAKPAETLYALATKWVAGESYAELILLGTAASRKWGKKTRKLTKSAIMTFIEGVLSYECVLMLGAVRIFAEGTGAEPKTLGLFDVLQKRLKYGLPSGLSSSIYEAGYSDRVIALTLEKALMDKGYREPVFNRGIVNQSNIRDVMAQFPSFFRSVSHRTR